jgi:hypothetical protein
MDNDGMIDKLLLIPAKLDKERDELAETWITLGGQVMRIDKFWVKPGIGTRQVAIYGNETFCLVLSQVLQKTLVTVEDEVIASLDYVWTKRHVQVKTLAECLGGAFPRFIKSVVPKAIKANVYRSAEELKSHVGQYDPAEMVIESAIIEIMAEVRVFVLDKTIADLAFYYGDGSIENAKRFALEFFSNCKVQLPRTFVMDLGFNEIDGWFIIEFNSVWGAGLNGCDPMKIINCILSATTG